MKHLSDHMRIETGRFGMLVILTVILLMMAASGCGGSGAQPEPGPTDGDQTPPDGEVDDDVQGDIDRPDGDQDPDREPVVDGDVVDRPDGDVIESDGDVDPESPPCTCPVVDGTFCIDPEISNPANYRRVVVSPSAETSCALIVNIRTEAAVAFVGNVECDEKGYADIPPLNCQLYYDLGVDQIKLLCGIYQYNFAREFCATIDGDVDPDTDTADGDTSEPDKDVPDGDGDPDVDGDADTTEPDIETPDGDIEPDADPDTIDGDTDEDAGLGCTLNEDCQTYWYCNLTGNPPWYCVEGECSDAKPCSPGYTCSQHGQCTKVVVDGDIAPDGDVVDGDTEDDQDQESGPECVVDLDCGYSHYCFDNKCYHDCWSDSDCGQGSECLVERGRCVPIGGTVCTSDDDCTTPYWNCNISGLCVEGECGPGTPCVGYGLVCNSHGRCVPEETDGDTDQDQETVCQTTDQCPMGMYCDQEECRQQCTTVGDCEAIYSAGWICNEHGKCVQDGPECQTDADCDAVGKPGHYCADGSCVQDCQTNDDCQSLGLCPPYCECGENGACLEVSYDGDIDTDTAIVCQNDDNQCPNGQYCDVDTCVSDCASDQECKDLLNDQNAYCDESRGKCHTIADGDIDDDYEPIEVYDCTTDQECIDQLGGSWRCQIAGGTGGFCIDECAACPPNYNCDENGICTAPVCESDDDCNLTPDGDFEFEPITQPCGKPGDEYCPWGYYCSDEGWCETECLPNCPEGTMCDPATFRCLATDGDVVENELIDQEGVCWTNQDCPHKSYCDNASGSYPYYCKYDCLEDRDCGDGLRCTPIGQCEPDYAQCVSDDSCAAGSYCEEYRFICTFQCKEPLIPCLGEGEVCDERGRCATADSDTDYTLPSCVYDEDCPSLSYCDGTTCKTDCLPPKVGCPPELSCDARGRCVTPPVDGDTDPEVDGDIDQDGGDGDVTEEEQGSEMLPCMSQSDCPFSTRCDYAGGPDPGQCQSECLCDYHCPHGKVCTCYGECADSEVTECTGYKTCTVNTDCEDVGMYCSDGVCHTDCLDNPRLPGLFPCPDDQVCGSLGQCVDPVVDGDSDGVEPTPSVPCASDADCPYHSSCNGELNMCLTTCTGDHHCPSGTKCDNRGNCTATPPPWDDGVGYPACATDADCPSMAYCWNSSYCRVDCIINIDTPFDCAAPEHCYSGRCVGSCAP